MLGACCLRQLLLCGCAATTTARLLLCVWLVRHWLLSGHCWDGLHAWAHVWGDKATRGDKGHLTRVPNHREACGNKVGGVAPVRQVDRHRLQLGTVVATTCCCRVAGTGLSCRGLTPCWC